MKKVIMQKRILFPLIFFCEIATFFAIASIFDLETNNSPFSLVYAYIIGFTIIGFLLKIVKDHKAMLSTIKIPIFGNSVLSLIYFLIVAMVLGLLQVTYMLLTRQLL